MKALITSQTDEKIPTVSDSPVRDRYPPPYAIQFCSRDNAHWRFFDSAHTRVEAETLLAEYGILYQAFGYEWRMVRLFIPAQSNSRPCARSSE